MAITLRIVLGTEEGAAIAEIEDGVQEDTKEVQIIQGIKEEDPVLAEDHLQAQAPAQNPEENTDTEEETLQATGGAEAIQDAKKEVKAERTAKKSQKKLKRI